MRYCFLSGSTAVQGVAGYPRSINYRRLHDHSIVSTATPHVSSAFSLYTAVVADHDDDALILLLQLISLKCLAPPWRRRHNTAGYKQKRLDWTRQTKPATKNDRCTAVLPARKGTVLRSCGTQSHTTCKQINHTRNISMVYTTRTLE